MSTNTNAAWMAIGANIGKQMPVIILEKSNKDCNKEFKTNEDGTISQEIRYGKDAKQCFNFNQDGTLLSSSAASYLCSDFIYEQIWSDLNGDNIVDEYSCDLKVGDYNEYGDIDASALINIKEDSKTLAITEYFIDDCSDKFRKRTLDKNSNITKTEFIENFYDELAIIQTDNESDGKIDSVRYEEVFKNPFMY